MSCVNRRFRNCLRHLPIEDLVEYYGLDTPLAIRLKHKANECTIAFVYEVPATYIGFQVLPKELNRYIMEYGGTRFCMRIHITPPQNYPFVPSTWTIKELFSNIQSEVDIVEHMSYLVDTHVEVYRRDNNWSPAITVEKDVLSFITKVIPCFDLLVKPFPT